MFIRLGLEGFMFMLLLSISELKQENDLFSHASSYTQACLCVAGLMLAFFLIPMHYFKHRLDVPEKYEEVKKKEHDDDDE